MNTWQDQTGFNDLWIINRDPKDPWFSYFDTLTQFELSRNARAFEHINQPWIFSGAKYLPATLVMIADFSETSIASQQKIWRDLGCPKATVFSGSKNEFMEKLTAVAPDSFRHIGDLP